MRVFRFPKREKRSFDWRRESKWARSHWSSHSQMENNQSGSSEFQDDARPKSVTLLIVLVLIMGVINIVRFIQTIKLWEFLLEILSISPVYLALTGFLWGFMGLILALGLFRGKKWAAKLMLFVPVFYFVYVWIDRLLIRVPASKNSNNPFVAGLSVLLLLLVYWTLSRKKVKAYFGETGETNEH